VNGLNAYRRRAMEFIKARNRRIAAYMLVEPPIDPTA
jgi:hypothetical protein